MGPLRAVLRLSALAAWTGGSVVYAWVTRRDWVQLWVRPTCRILGLTIVRSGPLPPRGTLVVANHVGYLDILALATQMDTRFIAKSEIAQWPLLGRLIRDAGTIFIHRQRLKDLPRVIADMHDRLAAGDRVTWFPEGTSTDGRDVLPFKSALLQTAITRDIPIHTVSLSFEAPPGVCPHERLCWHGTTSLAPHLWRLAQVLNYRMTLTFADRAVYQRDRKALARATRESVVEHRETSRVLRYLPERPSQPAGHGGSDLHPARL